MQATKLFYCYAREDKALQDQLVTQLAPLERLGLIAGWSDRDISAGQQWQNEIDKRLNTADIILLLISPDFIASNYCYSVEVKRAMERHEAGEARVIPIILRPVYWQAMPFGQLQALPTEGKPINEWRNRDKAFLNVVEGIREAVQDFEAKASASRATSATMTPENTTPSLNRNRSRYFSIMVAVLLIIVLSGGAIAVRSNFLAGGPRTSVMSLNDSGPGSLRQVIFDAQPGSTITFADNMKGIIILTNGELEITKNLAIRGPGASALSISGNFKSRIFLIDSNVTATISGLSIINGNMHADGNGVWGSTADSGGGIDNQGELTIDACTISGNRTARDGGGAENTGTLTVLHSAIFDNNASGVGGGIHTSGTNATISDSTVSSNIAGANGGGIDSGTTLGLNNSTVSGNIAAGVGGGVNAGGGADVLIFSSTLYDNTARSGGNIFDLNTQHPVIKLQHSIVAGGHTSDPNLEGYSSDIGGLVLMSGDGFNLIQDTSGAGIKLDSTHPFNLLNVDPQLGPLRNNGGLSPTYALLPSSPAIDAIPCDSSQVLLDQRGVNRPDDHEDHCDIGAYES